MKAKVRCGVTWLGHGYGGKVGSLLDKDTTVPAGLAFVVNQLVVVKGALFAALVQLP